MMYVDVQFGDHFRFLRDVHWAGIDVAEGTDSFVTEARVSGVTGPQGLVLAPFVVLTTETVSVRIPLDTLTAWMLRRPPTVEWHPQG